VKSTLARRLKEIARKVQEVTVLADRVEALAAKHAHKKSVVKKKRPTPLREKYA
jgi:D-serine deaminase-like pyridoxal phosphate-dependent protein